jgi:20S proteasome alpha/beta subunit
MESTFAIQGTDFILMIQESSVVHSIFKLKDVQEKFLPLDENILLGLTGDLGDQREFGSLVKANIQFMKFKNRRGLSVNETSNFIRNQLASSLRSNGAF